MSAVARKTRRYPALRGRISVWRELGARSCYREREKGASRDTGRQYEASVRRQQGSTQDMSTPTGKPLNPTALSADVSHKARNGTVTERSPSEDDNDPLRSSYAPKQAHQRVGTEQHPVETDRDPLWSPYAPKQARAQPAIVTSGLAAGDDAVRAPGGLHEQDRRDRSSNTALEEVAGEYPVDLEASASGQPAPNSGRHEQSAADRRGKIMRDHDLERLESALPWVHRQE